MSSNRTKVYSISVFKGASPCTVRTLKEVLDFIESDIEESDEFDERTITIEIGHMTEEEYEALEEWGGP